MFTKRFFLFTGLGLVLFLGIAFLILQSYVTKNINPYIDNLIKTGVSKSTNGLYSIKYSKLNFTIPTRTLVLRDIDLIPDTALYHHRKSLNEHVPNDLLTIHLDELRITGIEIYEAWANKSLETKDIVFLNPSIIVSLYDTVVRQDTISKTPVDLDLYKLFSEKFHSLTIKKIIVKNGKFRLYKNQTDTAATVSSDGIQIEIKKLLIDSAYSANRYEINLASKIKISIAEGHWILSDSIYRLQFANLNLDAIKNSVTLDKIQIIPLINKYKLSTIKGHQDDLITLEAQPIRLDSLDLERLIYNNSILCKKIYIEDLKLTAFRFKSGPNKSNYRRLPIEELRGAPLSIKIDSLILKNGRIDYSEQIPGNNFSGAIFFSKVNGSITNINNDFIEISKNPYCNLNLNGYLMGAASFKLNLALDQTSVTDSFTAEGTVGSLNLSLFNNLLLQNADVKLESGILKSAEFQIQGNNDRASGTMTMLYNDLKVLFVQDETDKQKDLAGKNLQKSSDIGLKKRIGSLFTNSFAIESDNPKNNVTRHVTLFTERSKDKYIFNYLWRIIFSGVKETVISQGFKNGKEKLKESSDKMKKLLK